MLPVVSFSIRMYRSLYGVNVNNNYIVDCQRSIQLVPDCNQYLIVIQKKRDM